MADNDLQLQLSVEVDASIAKAIADMEAISEESSEIEKGLAKISRQKAFDDLARDAAKLANETGDSAQATKILTRELDKLGAKENEVERLVKQYQRLQTEINQSATAQDRFDATSKDVALAGDVQSNLGAVSGLAGAAGAGGVSSAVSGAGEVVALIEELPRLKAAAAGLPATLASSAAALGPAGLLVVGIAAGTAAIVAIYKNSIKEQEKALESFAQASASYVDFLVNDGTLQGAENEIAQARAIIEAANAEKLVLEEKYQEQRFNMLDTLLNSGEQALVEQIKENETTISEAEGVIERYTQGLESGTLATQSAEEAENELAQRREEAGQQLIAQASFAGEMVALQQQSAEFNKEELATKRLGLEQTKAQTLAELALLEARSDGSEAVANQIANLKTEIGQLDESIAFLDSAQAKSAAAANSAKEAEEELAKEREASAKSTASVIEQERRIGDKAGGGRSIGGGRAGDEVEATRKRLLAILAKDANALFEDGSRIADSVILKGENGITDAYEDASQERLNIIRDYNQQETEIKRQALFDQTQDLEQFKFDQERLFETGDFTSAFNNQRAKAFQQGQDRDRIIFDQSTRRNDAFAQINDIASALATKIQVELQPNSMFNATVKNISVQSTTANRAF